MERIALPRDARTVPEDEVGGGAAYAASGLPNGGVPSDVESSAAFKPQRCLPSDCSLLAERPDGTFGLGSGGAEDHRRDVRRLRIANPSNYCYGNAAVLALCWLLCIGPLDDGPMFEPSLLLVLRWLRAQQGVVPLWQNIRWLTLHASWRAPSRQHDVIEYFTFLRPLLSPRIRFGSWEARQSRPEGTVSEDEGHTWPLLIPASLQSLAAQHQEPFSLQSLIELWCSAQVGLQALTSEPPVILIQICRFQLGPHSAFGSKVFFKVEPEPYLMIPAFKHHLNHTASLELQYSRYCRAATLIHEGSTPLAGHYRTILHDPLLGDFITNDSVSVQRLTADLRSHAQSNNYAFLYKYCPEMPAMP